MLRGFGIAQHLSIHWTHYVSKNENSREIFLLTLTHTRLFYGAYEILKFL